MTDKPLLTDDELVEELSAKFAMEMEAFLLDWFVKTAPDVSIGDVIGLIGAVKTRQRMQAHKMRKELHALHSTSKARLST